MICGIGIGLVFHFSNTFTTFLGLCMAITALPVSIRILMDLGKLQTDVGQRIISAAIFNDIVAMLILGIILDLNDVSKDLKDLTFSIGITLLKVLVFMAILLVAYKLFKLAKRKVNVVNPRMNKFFHYLRGQESMFALVILYVLIFSSIAELLGLHFVVGAFFGAILIPRSMFSDRDYERVHRSISGITMGFLAPIFFATMGLSFEIQSLNKIVLLVVVLFASFISKILGGYFGGRLAGFNQPKSVAIGLGLNARGIMELVIANIALQNGFIDIPMFSILVMMAILTTILTPIFLKYSFDRIDLY
jgi:Kef-type K+ transport system membrane component KefB